RRIMASAVNGLERLAIGKTVPVGASLPMVFDRSVPSDCRTDMTPTLMFSALRAAGILSGSRKWEAVLNQAIAAPVTRTRRSGIAPAGRVAVRSIIMQLSESI